MIKGRDGTHGWTGNYRESWLYKNDTLWTKKYSLLKGLGTKMRDKLIKQEFTILSQLKLTLNDND